MKKLLFIVFVCLCFNARASHERAGEITFKWISGYTYRIIVTTYTRGASTQADKCSLSINYGDDTAHHDIYRTNGPPCTGAYPSCPHCGVFIGLASDDVKMNVYDTIHTYDGPYTYTITVTDPNRNANIVNISNGSNNSTALSIFAVLTIPSTFGSRPYNTSPVLANPPIDKACVGKLFIHNAGATDLDGDSLSYKLGYCLEGPGDTATAYFIPPNVSIDPVTGDFIWNTPPPLTGTSAPDYDEYNFAFDIEEWATNLYTQQRFLIGVVRRDMQVTIRNCINEPPLISDVKDTCIVANTALTFTVTATDPDFNTIETFTATGGPFATTPAATFTSNAPIAPTSTGNFSWTPSCTQIRMAPYLVTFKATDDGAPDSPPVSLTDFESFFIRVIAPAPQILSLNASCAIMTLQWDTAPCNNLTGNYLRYYKIYRKVGCDVTPHGYCETGVPASWGYSHVGTVGSNVFSFVDNNGGMGLTQGVDYTYRVVAEYLDGAQSYASDPNCKHLVRDVPLITHVDVKTTGSINGEINVKWVKPLASPTDFDTIVNPGPYRFELWRGQGFSAPNTLVQTFTSPYFALLATEWLDQSLNTQNFPYTYRVDFYHDTLTTACFVQTASSVFLRCTPNDNEIQLTWQANVPWTNTEYHIYKFNGTTYDSIATTFTPSYTDTGLVNGAQYCYKIKAIGAYLDPLLPAPLVNWSQELCCSPVDLTPPCPLTLDVIPSCEFMQNELFWNNPNNSCCDDALSYNIYYKPFEDDDYTFLISIPDINTTAFLHDSILSIAGCYAVTAVDSFGNESAYSNVVCVDNCPYYELPNVFTPNGDNLNDFFTPLVPYKYVKDIDIKIYNRWGTEVFTTTDPKIMWDGTSVQTQMLCSDGVYYYVCVVNDIRLKGIIPRVLKGNVHLLSK